MTVSLIQFVRHQTYRKNIAFVWIGAVLFTIFSILFSLSLWEDDPGLLGCFTSLEFNLENVLDVYVIPANPCQNQEGKIGRGDPDTWISRSADQACAVLELIMKE